jgi:UDP-N-acetylmuramate dehydrogenase
VSKDALRKELRALISGTVLFDEPMARHTSMGVGGPADMLVYPRDVDELRKVIPFLDGSGVEYVPIGNCTNLIVRDGGYRGALVSLEKLKRLEKCGERGGTAMIAAGAGTLLSHAVDFSLKEFLSGLEFCAGIPGSVGGGVRMNAGAWGREMKDVVHSVECMDRGGALSTVEREHLHFEYRQLRLSRGLIITGAMFILGREIQDVIRRKIAGILSMRRKEQPLDCRSAGCIFRNPAGGFAGKLIDEAGLKGRGIGDACVSDRHANYIVNRGNARAEDIMTLIGIIQEEVRERFGVLLEPEVHIIGEARD